VYQTERLECGDNSSAEQVGHLWSLY